MKGTSRGDGTQRRRSRTTWRRKLFSAALAAFYGAGTAPIASGYAFNEIVPDVRLALAFSGGSACPVRAHQLTAPGTITVRWSTMLGTNPLTVLTLNQTASGRLAEVEQLIAQSMGAWTGVIGSTLKPGAVTPLSRVSSQNTCGSDGMNSICFGQADM